MAGPREMRRAAALLAVGCTVLAGCSSDPQDTPDDTTGTATASEVATSDGSWPDGLAALGILDPGVDVADEPGEVEGAAFRSGEDGEELVASDLVRTDADGFAEVRWFEGALARIDVDTLFEVTELELAIGQPTVSTRLEVGRVWNRLEGNSADYQVATDVGTAAVRGTAFLIACQETCTFAVAEGVLVITTSLGIELELRAGEQVEVDADGRPGAIGPFDHDDPWVQENLRRDEELGFAPIAPVAGDDDGTIVGEDDGRTAVAAGRMEGAYDYTFVMQESNLPELEGQTYERLWTFFPACDSGPCSGEWDPGDGGREPFQWTGRGYTTSWIDRPAGSCPDGSSRWLEDFVLVVTPTAVDDQGLVTALDATWESTLTPTQQAIDTGCDTGQEVEQFLSGAATPAGTGPGQG